MKRPKPFPKRPSVELPKREADVTGLSLITLLNRAAPGNAEAHELYRRFVAAGARDEVKHAARRLAEGYQATSETHYGNDRIDWHWSK